MLFNSPHGNLQVICSKTRIKYHPVTGDEIDRTPGIWANFGKLGDQYEYTNPETGEMMTGAQISGHYFDTDLEAAQNQWDPATKEMVERKLLGLCQREPGRIKVIERDTVKAAPPWPTYDDCDADQAVALASQLGFVAEALAYERENQDRPAAVDGFLASLDDDTDARPAEPGPLIDAKKVEALSKVITV